MALASQPDRILWGPDVHGAGIDVGALQGDYLVLWEAVPQSNFGFALSDVQKLSEDMPSSPYGAFRQTQEIARPYYALAVGLAAGAAGYTLVTTQPWYVTLAIGSSSVGAAGMWRRQRREAGYETPLLDAAIRGFTAGVITGGVSTLIPSRPGPPNFYQPAPHQIGSGFVPRNQPVESWWEYIWPPFQ
jgi:hypothetical protein